MAEKPIDELTIQITTTIDEATRSIDSLITKLGSLSNSITNVQNSLKGMNTSLTKVGSAVNKVNSSGIGKLNNSIKKTSSSVMSLTKGFGKWALGLFTANISLKSISNHVSKCLELSTDYTEVLNKLTVAMDSGSDVMGEYSDEAVAFAETVQNALGVDMVEWLDYQGTFASLFKGFKVQEDHMAFMSQQLTQLAYDYSSLYNKPVSEAFNKLNSALSGQIKGLKDYGNNVSVAMVQQTALQFGITEQISKLDTATQAYLRYITIMNNAKATGVFTDMNRTIDSTANQMRVMESLITQFKRSLGDIYNIVATLILPVFIRVVGVITLMVKKFKEFLITAFNLKDVIDFGAGISSVTTDFQETTDAVNETAKAVKKYKKSLQGFDEINTISNGSSDASTDTGTGGLGGYSFDIGDLPQYDFLDGYTASLQAEFEALYNKIMPVVTALGKLAIIVTVGSWIAGLINIIPPVIEAFQFLGLCVSTFVGEILAGNGVLSGISAVFGSATATAVSFATVIASVVAVITAVVGAFVQLWNTNDEWKQKVITAWENIKSLLKSVYDNVILPIFNGIVTALKYSWEWGIKPLWDKWVEFVGAVSGVMLDLFNFISPIVTKLVELLNPVFGGAFEIVGTVVAVVVAGICNVFNLLLTVATGVFNGIGNLINIVSNFVNKVIEFFAYLYDVLVGHSIVPDLVNAVIQWFADLVSNIVTAVTTFVSNIISFFVNLYNGIVGKFKQIKTAIVTKVKEIWTAISDWFKTKVAPIFTLDYWKKKFSKIASAIANSGIVKKAKEIWSLVKEWFAEKVAPIFTLDYWKKKFIKIANAIGNSGIVKKAKEIWSLVKDWFKTYVAPKFTLTYWKSKISKIADAFGNSGIVKKVKEIWGNIKQWFTDNVAPKFTLTYWSDKFSGIGSGFKEVIKNMINAGIDMINQFIGWLNTKLNLSWDGLSILGKEIFPAGEFQLFTIPTIPKLADGGAPNKGQLFYANERGAELVSHIGGQSVVANNQDMLDLAKETMVDTFLKLAMKGNSTQPVHITVNTQLDKKTIAKSTVEYVNGQIRQTGVNPIKG